MRRCVECNREISSEDWSCRCGKKPERVGGFLSFAPEVLEGAAGFDRSFEQLIGVEDRSFWLRARGRLIVDLLRRHFPNAQKLLEIGCGNGHVLVQIQSRLRIRDIWGSDALPEALTYARARVPDASFFQADARTLPFREEFDVICALDVLEHIEDDEEAMRESYAALRAGGGLIVTVPQHQFLWSAADDYAFHKRRYNRSELLRKLRDAGFEIRYAGSFVTFLLPGLLLSRLRRHRIENFDPLAEFRLPGWLNSFLYGVLTVERMLILSGVRFPAGGSLVAVAVKTR